ncbi:MAG: response regulator transcription factor [Chloroflexota bacterium]
MNHALILNAVRSAARGQSVLDPNVAGSVLQELVHGKNVQNDLTKRETQVLRQIAHGMTNREIAEHFTIGEETVKTHVGNILAKLHLAHRTQVALYAVKRGYVSLDELEL